METFDEVKKNWDRSQSLIQNPISKESMDTLIRAKVKREKRTIMEYFWGSFFYQNLIYGFGSYFIVRYWGTQEVVLPVLFTMLLYIPFTLQLLKRFKSMLNPRVVRKLEPINASAYVAKLYAQLVSFYHFKRRFDWMSTPVSCAAIVGITFNFFTDGLQKHLLGASMLFAGWIALFTIAIYFENQNHFKRPILKLESILNEMKMNF